MDTVRRVGHHVSLYLVAAALFTMSLLALGLPGVGQAATLTFSLLADTTTAIPGGTGTFTAFTPDPLLPPSPTSTVLEAESRHFSQLR